MIRVVRNSDVNEVNLRVVVSDVIWKVVVSDVNICE